MSWEIDSEYLLRCEVCGKVGKEINSSDDWNRYATSITGFPTKWVGGNEPGIPNYGAFEVPICPACGENGRIVRSRIEPPPPTAEQIAERQKAKREYRTQRRQPSWWETVDIRSLDAGRTECSDDDFFMVELTNSPKSVEETRFFRYLEDVKGFIICKHLDFEFISALEWGRYVKRTGKPADDWIRFYWINALSSRAAEELGYGIPITRSTAVAYQSLPIGRSRNVRTE